MRKKFFLALLVVCAVTTVATAGQKTFSVIFDFREGVWDRCEKIIGDLPSSASGLTAMIIPGHSSRGLKNLSEEAQAKLAQRRSAVVAKMLATKGGFKTEAMPGLEIGSKVWVWFVPPYMEVTQQEFDRQFDQAMAEVIQRVKALEEEQVRIKERLTAEAKIRRDADTALATQDGVLADSIGFLDERVKTLEKPALWMPPDWLLGTEIGLSNQQVSIAHKFRSFPISACLIQGISPNKHGWGFGGTVYARGWELGVGRLYNKLPDPRGDEVVITDMQVIYCHYLTEQFSISIGGDYGWLKPLESEYRNGQTMKVEGHRAFGILRFLYTTEKWSVTEGGAWKLKVRYTPEWISLKVGEFKQDAKYDGTEGLEVSVSYVF